MITLQQLQAMCETAEGKKRCEKMAPILDDLLPKSTINTPVRAAMFLAQALHESGEFQWLRELGGDAYFAKYDTGPLAKRLGNTPEADGDGQKYRGRGIFQITGRSNYSQCANALKLPLLEKPELLEEPKNAVASAIWYWESRGLNRHADNKAITACSIAINGGTNGIDARRRYYTKARLALGVKL